MELLYLYIEDDGKNIKDCEFNFSSDFKFSYNREEKIVTVIKNENFIPNFWEAENVSSITAVIGKNGAGKSNLFEFIARYYSSSFGLSNKSKKNLLHIYRLNGQLYINRKDVKSDFPLLEQHYIQYPLNDHNKSNLTKLLYYTPHYEKNILFDLHHVSTSDISNGGLLRQFGNDLIILKDIKAKSFTDIERLCIEDTFRQIELFSYSKTDYFEGLNLPTALSIVFKEGAKKLDIDNKLYNKLYIDKPLSKLSFSEHIQNRLLYHFFSNEAYVRTLDIHDEMSFEEFIRLTHGSQLYSELAHLDRTDGIIFEKYPEQMGSRTDYQLKFLIKREYLSFDFMSGLYKYYFHGDVFGAPKTLETIRILHSNVTFEWIGLSSGELEYFNLLSRIYCNLQNVIIVPAKKLKQPTKPQKEKNIILLLDEPENAFHPEWQRLFIENLICFFKNALPFYKFQIIIASHSPILASDFPKNNIIFLDKNEDGTCKVVDSICQENTFGANIQTLYRNSFFLKGLPIGEFAKRKINKLFEELERGYIRPTTLQEIQLVGEPLLKNQLMKLYKQCKDLPQSVNKRITQLEEEVRILKNKLNDQNRTL
jgi:predicted ATPase